MRKNSPPKCSAGNKGPLLFHFISTGFRIEHQRVAVFAAPVGHFLEIPAGGHGQQFDRQPLTVMILETVFRQFDQEPGKGRSISVFCQQNDGVEIIAVIRVFPDPGHDLLPFLFGQVFQNESQHAAVAVPSHQHLFLENGGISAAALNVMTMMVLLSVNLGIMNLLPIPALDGGRLLFFAAEAVTGRHLNRDVEGAIHFAGLVLLMGLMVFLMFHDVMRLMSG